MVTSTIFTFADPYAYQAAVRAADVEVFVTAKGDFRAELTKIDLPRLWMQRGCEDLPRVCHAAVSAERAPIFFLAAANQAAMQHSGMEISPNEIVVYGTDSTHSHLTRAPCSWGAMSLTPQDLAGVGYALVGRDLTVPQFTHLVRPAPALMSRLLNLHQAAGQLAKFAPDILTHPQVARALEQTLLHAMIMCLIEGTSIEVSPGGRRHQLIITRLEELLAANYDRPLYLAEICAAIGASERTLRMCCREHLGMGPVRYLWLRRMHLARRALILANPMTKTVTHIATDHGFWELGRFSVEYRALFGESPSASLHGPADERWTSPDRPLALAASDSA